MSTSGGFRFPGQPPWVEIIRGPGTKMSDGSVSTGTDSESDSGFDKDSMQFSPPLTSSPWSEHQDGTLDSDTGGQEMDKSPTLATPFDGMQTEERRLSVLASYRPFSHLHIVLDVTYICPCVYSFASTT